MRFADRLVEAVERAWAARDRELETTGFGICARPLAPRFVVARAPKGNPEQLLRDWGLDRDAIEQMTRGSCPYGYGMESERWGERFFEPLRAEWITMSSTRQRALVIDSAERLRAVIPVTLFYWMKHPDDRETTRFDAERLNPPENLERWEW